MFEKLLKSDRLLARCVRGGTVLATGSIFERGVRFISNLILVRLLAPEQFGLMAIVLASNTFFEIITEIGVRQSIIQNKKGDETSFLNAAWWYSSGRGILIYIIGFIAAPYVSSFYQEPELTLLLRIAFLTMFFRGFINPQLYVLEKKLMFGRYVWIVNGSALCGTLLTLGMTLWMPNVWALVFGFVTESSLRFVFSFIFCRFRPTFQIDRNSWKELFHFSKRIAGVPVLTFIFLQADIFVLGKVSGKELLGLYAMVLTLASMPEMIFTRVVVPMILPVLSETQDRIETLRERLLRMTWVIFTFGFPMATSMAVFSESILTILYGSRYAVLANAFTLLNFYTLLYISGVFIASTYTALGRPDVHRIFTGARIIVLGIVLYPGIMYFGVTGAAGARVICMVLAGIVQQWNLSRLIQLPIRQYLMTAKDGFVISAVVLILGLIFRMLSGHAVYHLVTAVVLCTASWIYILWTWHKSGHFLSKSAQITVSVP